MKNAQDYDYVTENESSTPAPEPDITMLKQAQARLSSFRPLKFWAWKIIMEAQGKPTFFLYRMDMRKMKEPEHFFIALKAMIKMFKLNQDHEYKRHPELFDHAGYRATSHDELCYETSRLGLSGGISAAQATRMLSVFEKAGFIDRRAPFNAGTKTRRLWIRLRADNILKAIERVSRIKKPRGKEAISFVEKFNAGIKASPVNETFEVTLAAYPNPSQSDMDVTGLNNLASYGEFPAGSENINN